MIFENNLYKNNRYFNVERVWKILYISPISIQRYFNISKKIMSLEDNVYLDNFLLSVSSFPVGRNLEDSVHLNTRYFNVKRVWKIMYISEILIEIGRAHV